MNRKQKLYSILAISTAAMTFGFAQAQNVPTEMQVHQAATAVQLAEVSKASSVTTSQWLNLRQIYDKLESEGYTDITEIERDDGGYEAKANNPQGSKVKLYIEPRTGDVLRVKTKRN